MPWCHFHSWPTGRRIYVSVAVGNDIKKTDVFKRKEDDKTSPSWDEELVL